MSVSVSDLVHEFVALHDDEVDWQAGDVANEYLTLPPGVQVKIFNYDAAMGRVDPTLALWGPFVVFTAMILWMFRQVAHVPGGQSIGWLERLSENVAKRLRSLSSRRRSGQILPVGAAS